MSYNPLISAISIMARSVDKSHPDFPELFYLADTIAKGTSPQRWFDGAQAQRDGTTGTPEYKADLIVLRNRMDELLEGGKFRDFIEEMKRW